MFAFVFTFSPTPKANSSTSGRWRQFSNQGQTEFLRKVARRPSHGVELSVLPNGWKETQEAV
jgi:hypothetical protein